MRSLSVERPPKSVSSSFEIRDVPFFGTALAGQMLRYREDARGVLMRTTGSRTKLGAAVRGAAAGLAVVTVAILCMWLLLVSY